MLKAFQSPTRFQTKDIRSKGAKIDILFYINDIAYKKYISFVSFSLTTVKN